jgi:hypothetical protein
VGHSGCDVRDVVIRIGIKNPEDVVTLKSHESSCFNVCHNHIGAFAENLERNVHVQVRVVG